MTKRAYTLTEVVIAVGLLSLVVAAVTSLFGFASRRSAHNAARFVTYRAVSSVGADLASTIENAISCETVPNGSSSALACIMPLIGTDTDADGFNESFQPIRIGKRGQVHYAQGQRVWYYLAAADGQFGFGGGYMFRAVRSDLDTPTAADIDQAWSEEYGAGRPKRGPFLGGTFNVDPAMRTVAFALQAQAAVRSGLAPIPGEDTQVFSIDGAACWRNEP